MQWTQAPVLFAVALLAGATCATMAQTSGGGLPR